MGAPGFCQWHLVGLGAYVVLFAPLLDRQSARPAGLHLLAPLCQLGRMFHCPDIHVLIYAFL